MIKDERNYHLRLQEFCDCYLETDPKKELEKASKGMSGDPGRDADELALKFLGLGIFYGVSEKAKKVTLQRSKEGKVIFAVESEPRSISALPSGYPGRRPNHLDCPIHHSH